MNSKICIYLGVVMGKCFLCGSSRHMMKDCSKYGLVDLILLSLVLLICFLIIWTESFQPQNQDLDPDQGAEAALAQNLEIEEGKEIIEETWVALVLEEGPIVKEMIVEIVDPEAEVAGDLLDLLFKAEVI